MPFAIAIAPSISTRTHSIIAETASPAMDDGLLFRYPVFVDPVRHFVIDAT